MNARQNPPSNRRQLIILVGFTILLLAFFWLQSRYPALNEKALMGGETETLGIAFDILVAIVPDSGFWWKVAANTANWLYTNWKGMTFGVLFGAILLTGLGLVKQRSFKNRYANAALGAVIGTPLGVCVNCAAPIAAGLHAAGMRIETTLAALIASPTLNVIVVSMSFAILPAYVAWIKVVSMLVLILIGIPLITKYAVKGEDLKFDPSTMNAPGKLKSQGFLARILLQEDGQHISRVRNTLGSSFVDVSYKFARNLAFLAIITVPLMVLAGFLGAVLVTWIPVGQVLSFTRLFNDPISIILVMFVIAAFALFLPVPIAFDVVLAAILLLSGWPVHFVVPMLIGLGAYSIYSFLIMARAVSYRLSSIVSVSVLCLAVFAGVVAHYVEKIQIVQGKYDNSAILSGMSMSDFEASYRPKAETYAILAPLIAAQAVVFDRFDTTVQHNGSGKISIEIAKTEPDLENPQEGTKAFSFERGDAYGLDERHTIHPLSRTTPYNFTKTIAAGDVHGDGWIDLVIGSGTATGGASLYANMGGIFKRQELDLSFLNGGIVSNIALVDLNSDARLDVFISTIMQGTHVLWNQGGNFTADARTELPNSDAYITTASGFADFDGDGNLDIVLGNGIVSLGKNATVQYGPKATNRVLWNEGDGTFTPKDFELGGARTLTILITDINEDDEPDILIGDDNGWTDTVYTYAGNREFRFVTRSDGLIPETGKTTMSFDAADWQRNGRQAIYLGQALAENDLHPSEFLKQTKLFCQSEMQDPNTQYSSAENCFNLAQSMDKASQISRRNRADCNQLSSQSAKALCATRNITTRALKESRPEMCDPIRRFSTLEFENCEVLFSTDPWERPSDLFLKTNGYITGKQTKTNLLMLQNEIGIFETHNDLVPTTQPGWTWNSRFVDLDQDGWQDIFIATGLLKGAGLSPNAFFKNLDGQKFVDQTEDFGLSDLVPTLNYAALDFDRDGDIDIIRGPTASSVIVNKNIFPHGPGFTVRLNDGIGNEFGVGATVTIETMDGLQSREIRASGGYSSFDPQHAAFGLGESKTVAFITVLWRDGSQTKINGPFPANSDVVVKRE